jgi:hypothetical protein
MMVLDDPRRQNGIEYPSYMRQTCKLLTNLIIAEQIDGRIDHTSLGSVIYSIQTSSGRDYSKACEDCQQLLAIGDTRRWIYILQYIPESSLVQSYQQTVSLNQLSRMLLVMKKKVLQSFVEASKDILLAIGNQATSYHDLNQQLALGLETYACLRAWQSLRDPGSSQCSEPRNLLRIEDWVESYEVMKVSPYQMLLGMQSSSLALLINTSFNVDDDMKRKLISIAFSSFEIMEALLDNLVFGDSNITTLLQMIYHLHHHICNVFQVLFQVNIHDNTDIFAVDLDRIRDAYHRLHTSNINVEPIMIHLVEIAIQIIDRFTINLLHPQAWKQVLAASESSTDEVTHYIQRSLNMLLLCLAIPNHPISALAIESIAYYPKAILSLELDASLVRELEKFFAYISLQCLEVFLKQLAFVSSNHRNTATMLLLGDKSTIRASLPDADLGDDDLQERISYRKEASYLLTSLFRYWNNPASLDAYRLLQVLESKLDAVHIHPSANGQALSSYLELESYLYSYHAMIDVNADIEITSYTSQVWFGVLQSCNSKVFVSLSQSYSVGDQLILARLFDFWARYLEYFHLSDSDDDDNDELTGMLMLQQILAAISSIISNRIPHLFKSAANLLDAIVSKVCNAFQHYCLEFTSFLVSSLLLPSSANQPLSGQETLYLALGKCLSSRYAMCWSQQNTTGQELTIQVFHYLTAKLSDHFSICLDVSTINAFNWLSKFLHGSTILITDSSSHGHDDANACSNPLVDEGVYVSLYSLIANSLVALATSVLASNSSSSSIHDKSVNLFLSNVEQRILSLFVSITIQLIDHLHQAYRSSAADADLHDKLCVLVKILPISPESYKVIKLATLDIETYPSLQADNARIQSSMSLCMSIVAQINHAFASNLVDLIAHPQFEMLTVEVLRYLDVWISSHRHLLTIELQASVSGYASNSIAVLYFDLIAYLIQLPSIGYSIDAKILRLISISYQHMLFSSTEDAGHAISPSSVIFELFLREKATHLLANLFLSLCAGGNDGHHHRSFSILLESSIAYLHEGVSNDIHHQLPSANCDSSLIAQAALGCLAEQVNHNFREKLLILSRHRPSASTGADMHTRTFNLDYEPIILEMQRGLHSFLLCSPPPRKKLKSMITEFSKSMKKQLSGIM